MEQEFASIREIMEKIKDIKKLPSYEEAERLLHFLEDGSHSDYSRNRWLGFCKDQGLYNVYNTEFVDALAREIKRLKDSPIVEICAGRGELSYQLKKRGIDIKPTDDYSGRLSKEGLVERLSHKRALEKYKPRVVLAAWIPHQVIRFDVLDYPTVRYFIDIGESTWMPCGICDKWDRIYLENLDEYSICRLDYIGGIYHSHVSLFSRKAPEACFTRPNPAKAELRTARTHSPKNKSSFLSFETNN